MRNIYILKKLYLILYILGRYFIKNFALFLFVQLPVAITCIILYMIPFFAFGEIIDLLGISNILNNNFIILTIFSFTNFLIIKNLYSNNLFLKKTKSYVKKKSCSETVLGTAFGTIFITFIFFHEGICFFLDFFTKEIPSFLKKIVIK